MKYTEKLEILENGDGLIKFPEEFVEQFHIKEGDKVELISTDASILLKPLKNKPNLDDLLDVINDDNLHDEIDIGGTGMGGTLKYPKSLSSTHLKNVL